MESTIIQFVTLAFVLIVALTFHEFGHAWTAYKLGDPTAYQEGRVTLNPIVHLDLMGSLCFLVTQGFGWAKPVPVNPRNFRKPRRDDILVTAAGPFANLILGTLSILVYIFLLKRGVFNDISTVPLLQLLQSFLYMMVSANFFLMFFNLIPLFPLDGSHIVTNLLPLNQAYQFKRFNENYGPWILLGIVTLGYTTGGRIDPIGWVIREPVQLMIKGLAKFGVWAL